MNYEIRIDLYETKYCYLDNKLHREDGPAFEHPAGPKLWYKNGKRHRENGPAVEYISGEKQWYLDDKEYGINNAFTNKSWQSFVKTLIFS